MRDIDTEDRPQGALNPVRVEQRRSANSLAVHANVVCVDEAGDEWFFEAAAFIWQCKRVLSEQSKGPTDAG